MLVFTKLLLWLQLQETVSDTTYYDNIASKREKVGGWDKKNSGATAWTALKEYNIKHLHEDLPAFCKFLVLFFCTLTVFFPVM